MPKQLTVIINTLNDHFECNQTVKSLVNTSGDSCDIIVIDDSSEPAQDLELDHLKFITTFRTKRRMGVGPTRHLAAMMAQTPYLLIIDSHMRFKPGWYEKAIERIMGREETIHCATCLGLDRTQGMNIDAPNGIYRGATINFWGPDQNNPTAKQLIEGIWLPDHTEDDNEIPCVMGACYFIPRNFFFRIGGLKSLMMWGSDEPFLSLKAWMAGGECRYMRNVEIGHKFKHEEASPYITEEWNILYNKLMMIETLLPEDVGEFLLQRFSPSVELKKAFEVFWTNFPQLRLERAYYQSIFKREFRWYCDKFEIGYPARAS